MALRDTWFFCFPALWIRVKHREQSPVHFTCPSLSTNTKYEFNILPWGASLCKLLGYSILDVCTHAHILRLLLQALPRSFQHKRISTYSYCHKSEFTLGTLLMLSICIFTPMFPFAQCHLQLVLQLIFKGRTFLPEMAILLLVIH